MRFELNKEVTTDKPTVEVDPLPRGRYRFRLVVVDKQGRSSPPAEIVVIVG